MTAIHYDAEFLEDGRTIELISIGLVRESDGAEYYAVTREATKRSLRRRIRRSPWLMDNVVPSLPRPHGDWIMSMPDRWLFNYLDPAVKPREQIAREVRDFILAAPDPELWAWYGAYDHVVLCQLWGRMVDLPPGVPMFTRDLKQECERLGGPDLPHMPGVREHDALSDAREVAFRHRWLLDHAAATEAEPDAVKALAEAERIIAERDEQIAGLRDRCDELFAVNRGLREQAAEVKAIIEKRSGERHDIDCILDGVPGLSQDSQVAAVGAMASRLKASEAENATLREALASRPAPASQQAAGTVLADLGYLDDLARRAERAEARIAAAVTALRPLAKLKGPTIAERSRVVAQVIGALEAEDAGEAVTR